MGDRSCGDGKMSGETIWWRYRYQSRRGHRLGCVGLDIWARRQGDNSITGQGRKGHRLGCVGLEQPYRRTLLVFSVGGGVVADSEVELRRWADSAAIATGDTVKRVEQGRTWDSCECKIVIQTLRVDIMLPLNIFTFLYFINIILICVLLDTLCSTCTFFVCFAPHAL
jgi:hypothetical protein